jgi:hypothetical protein
LERNQLDSFGDDDEGDEAQLVVVSSWRRTLWNDGATVDCRGGALSLLSEKGEKGGEEKESGGGQMDKEH